ncbi:MAG: hopanoid biosynthesis-associated protein HpnK [Nitrospirae bacterium]|nr:hopanoid biosynthesis-associated protein HpnK [Nitrospirota bacterium]
MPSISKILIVNADDFGLTQSVNQGIVRCFREGIVTSASILTNGKAFKEAVRLTKENNLDVGIHLTLMEGKPVSEGSQVQSLINKEGYFPKNYINFSLKYFCSKISLNDIETELRAQIEKFLGAGLKPTHVNSHNHVHMFPGIIDVVIRLMKQYGIKFIRIPVEPVISLRDRFSFNAVAKLFLVALARTARHKILNYGLRTTDFFEGLFISGRLSRKNLIEVLGHIKPGVTELMCHPGYVDAELLDLHPWNYNWDKELEALCDEEVKKKVESLGIKLAGFGASLN